MSRASAASTAAREHVVRDPRFARVWFKPGGEADSPGDAGLVPGTTLAACLVSTAAGNPELGHHPSPRTGR